MMWFPSSMQVYEMYPLPGENNKSDGLEKFFFF